MRSARGLSVALALVLAVGLTGCGNDDKDSSTDDAATATTSTTVEIDPLTGNPVGNGHDHQSMSVDSCAMHMPEDVLSAEEAMITFKDTKVCLGYVTVRPGTDVTWVNLGDDAATLTIYDEHPSEKSAKPVATIQIKGKSDHFQGFDSPGSRYYTLSVLPGFVGTVEVKAP